VHAGCVTRQYDRDGLTSIAANVRAAAEALRKSRR
jgi:hypothetical protein